MPIVSGGRPGYVYMVCGQIEGPNGTQLLLPIVAPIRRRATKTPRGHPLAERPSDALLKRVVDGLRRITAPAQRPAEGS